MPPGPKPKHTDFISLRLEPDMRKVLEGMAEKEERTISQMARILIREAVGHRKAKEGAAGQKKGR